VLPDGLQTGFPPLHVAVQLPQWVAVVTSVSQPSLGSPLQSAQPATHAEALNAHLFEAHEVAPAVTWLSTEQSLSHRPQCARSLLEKHPASQDSPQAASAWSGAPPSGVRSGPPTGPRPPSSPASPGPASSPPFPVVAS
jgi:hypothetical protein